MRSRNPRTDRQRQSAPALFEVKVAAPRRRFPLWAVALGVLLGVNVAGAGSGSAAPARDAARRAGKRRQRQRRPQRPSVDALPGMVTVPAHGHRTFPADAAPTVTCGPSSHDAGVVAPSAAPPLAEEPLLAGQSLPCRRTTTRATTGPAITPAQAERHRRRAPRRRSLPSRDEVLAQGTQLPELRLDLHVYDADPAKRFVFINMRKLREGESLPEGVRVDAITPDRRAAFLPRHAVHAGRELVGWQARLALDRPLLGFPREVVAFEMPQALEAGLAQDVLG